MSNAISGANRSLQTSRRMAWLLRVGIEPLPSDTQDVTEAQSRILDELARQMQRAGLYSGSTELQDIRWGIRVLVGRIRRTEATG